MNQGSFNKQATFLQKDPQFRNISATAHANMSSPKTKLMDSLPSCDDTPQTFPKTFSFTCFFLANHMEC